MKLKITYRKGSRPVIVESQEDNISSIAYDCANQLAEKYRIWRIKTNNPISKQSLKRYEIGQRYMLIQKLEGLIK